MTRSRSSGGYGAGMRSPLHSHYPASLTRQVYLKPRGCIMYSGPGERGQVTGRRCCYGGLKEAQSKLLNFDEGPPLSINSR